MRNVALERDSRRLQGHARAPLGATELVKMVRCLTGSFVIQLASRNGAPSSAVSRPYGRKFAFPRSGRPLGRSDQEFTPTAEPALLVSPIGRLTNPRTA
jgi:hypothetical protein